MKVVVLLLAAMMLSAEAQVSRIKVMVLEDPKVNPLLINPAPEDQAPRFLSVEIQPGFLANFPVQLGTPSKQIEINGGRLEIPLIRGRNPKKNAWTKVTLPKAGDYLVVIVQSPRPKKMGWRKVTSYVFEDEEGIAPEGGIRVLNASQKDLALRIGDLKAKALKPGKSIALPHPDEDSEFKIAQKDEAGAYKMIRKNMLGEREKGVRKSYFVYQDGNLAAKSLLHIEEVKAPKE